MEGTCDERTASRRFIEPRRWRTDIQANEVTSLNIGWPEHEVIIEQEHPLQNRPEQFKLQKTGQ